MHLPKLAIIAGSGSLPIEIYNLYKKAGGQVFLINLISKTDNQINDHGVYFSMGQVGKIIDYLNNHHIKDLIIAGNVERPNLSSIKLDVTGSILMATLLKQKILGDDRLLSIIANFIEKKGFNIISPLDILNLYQQTFSTKIKINKQQHADINIGSDICKAIGSLDIGQAIVIEDRYILGVEAAEGTDNLIIRCAKLRKNDSGGILIKMMKPNQDRRLDLPTIGPETINNLHKFNYSGIAISSDVIIVDKEVTFKLADEHKIFIHII